MSSTLARKAYPSDISDEEWSLVAPYITLMTEAAPQRDYPMGELLNALRYLARYGIAWRAMPNDFPPWSAVYQQGVGESAATALALVCNEQATDSAKYGVLSASEGTLHISCTDDTEPIVVVSTEGDGPPVLAHRSPRGFGSKLFNRSVSGELCGGIDFCQSARKRDPLSAAKKDPSANVYGAADGWCLNESCG